MTDKTTIPSDEELTAYLDGELPPAEAARLEALLETDADLAARLEFLSRASLPFAHAFDPLLAQAPKAELEAILSRLSATPAPSLDAQLASEIGFRADVERVPVFGLGCAAGVSGFAIAARLAKARPGATVLFVSIELCTLAFRLDALTRANIIATALFGDGAAACVLRAGPEGLAAVESTGEHLFPDTLGIMGWKIDDTGFGIVLAQSLPPFAEKELGPAIDGILDRNGLSRTDIDRFICHPGGARVLAALETALSIPSSALDHERAVLEEYGNMSSPTVLFVLERVLREGLPERAAMIAMGPGFSASCVTLTRA